MKLIDYLVDLKRILGPQIKLAEFQRQWLQDNKHNNTRAGRIFPKEKVNVGKYTYGTLNVISYDSNGEHLKIGNYCSIAGETKFILSGEHDYHRISTFPFSKVALHRDPESISKGPIIVDDDVWIGYGCIILSGVHIGRGAVIGAGSIIYKDIPPYAVYAGGRLVKYRFSDEVITKLCSKPMPLLSEEEIENKLAYLETQINDKNVDEILSKLI